MDPKKYKSFGKHIGFGLVKKFITLHQKNWQLELAKYTYRMNSMLENADRMSRVNILDSSLARKYDYKKNYHVYQALGESAKEFLQHYKKTGALPAIDSSFYQFQYGTKKVLLKKDDTILRLAKQRLKLTDDYEKQRVLRDEIRQWEKTVDIYEWQRAEALDKLKIDQNNETYKKLIESINNPNTGMFRPGLINDLTVINAERFVEKIKEWNLKWYENRKGEDLEYYLGKVKEELPYKGIIEWIVQNWDSGGELILSSSNKWALRQSDKFRWAYLNSPKLRRKAAEIIARDGLDVDVDGYLKMEYLKEFGDPSKTSMSGVPYPFFQGGGKYSQAWHSQFGFKREFVQRPSGFPGLEAEQKEAIKTHAKLHAPDMLYYQEINKAKEIKSFDYRQTFEKKDTEELFRGDLEIKWQERKNKKK